MLTLDRIDQYIEDLMNVQNQQAKRIAELEETIVSLQLRVKDMEVNHEKLRMHLDKVYHL